MLINSILNHYNDKIKCNEKKYATFILLLKIIPILLSFFIIKNIFLFLIFAIAWFLVISIFFDHRDLYIFKPIIRIWFGVPGSGKSTIGAMLSRNSNNKGIKVLSNVPIKNTFKLEDTDLGTYDMSFEGHGCHVILDEALVKGFYNREFKAFAKSNKPLYSSEHRHMNNQVDVFSQGYDIDLNIKQRAGENGLFHLSKLPLKGFLMYRRIKKIFFIKKEDKQFLDGFKYKGLPRIIYCKKVWQDFDTNDMTDCPKEQKHWELWSI